MPAPAKILGPNGKPLARSASPSRVLVRARYDSAETNADTRRLWAAADGLSARAANSPEVRRVLRNRARFVRGNNSYLEGITQTLANDVIGTGPRLRLLTPDRAVNRRVGDAFEAWSAATGFAEKLRTVRMSRVIDGEGIGLLITNPRLPTPVKLDIRLIEADMLATPFLNPLDPLAVDGIEFDRYGNPVVYHVLREHPGDLTGFGAAVGDYDRIPAEFVLHWFRVDRAGQVRGVPDITSSITDFAEVQRWNRAVLAAAETAADFAGVMESDAPADPSEAVEGEPFDTVEIEKRLLMNLPAGHRLSQLKAEQPTTTHSEYERVSVRRIVRCLNMPLNVALGDSSGFNYASGRLDHQVYHRSIGVDRYFLETAILDRILAAWIKEARAVAPDIVDGLPESTWSATPRHTWHWDGFKHVDPLKEANAATANLQNGTTSLARECAENGDDWQEIAEQRGEERAYFAALGLPYPGDPPTSAASASPEPDDDEPASTEAAMISRQRLVAEAEPATLRTIGMPVEIEAARGEGKRPTFSIVGYTGAPMNVFGFFSPVIVDLVGMRAASQEIPALRDHDTGRIVGQTSAISIGKEVTLSGTITGDNADATEVVSQSKNGFKWQASIGADIVRREFVEAGKSVTVNGREVSGPIVIARETVLREISFVAIGADGGTSANVAASNPNGTHNGSYDVDFNAWLKAKGFGDPAALSDDQRTSLKAMYDAEQRAATQQQQQTTTVTQQQPQQQQQRTATTAVQAAATTPTPTAEDIFAAARKERERREQIKALAQAAIDGRPMLIEQIEALHDQAIEAGHSVEQFDTTLLRLRAEAYMPQGFAVHSGGQQSLNNDTLEATICRSIGLGNLEKHFGEKVLASVDRRFPHGLGLKELLQIAARENGHGGISLNNPQALLKAALPPEGIRAQGYSTISLPGVLGNVANKFIVDAFNAVESSWRQIAATRPVNDFKAISSYSLTGNLMLEKVGPTGEIAHGTLGELTYTNQAETYAKMLAITRKDIINDDLGAFAKVPRMLGRGAALKLNDVFWTVFLAGVGSFWTSGNANLSTGGGTVLSSAALKTLTDQFKKQTDPDGFPLGAMPRILLVPTELEVTADELMTSIAINTGGSSTTDVVPNTNVWRSKYRPVSSTYLSNDNYTGYSATAWYLLADPNDIPTIEVAFLNGREMPMVENAEADFNSLGVQFRCVHDFGVSLMEYRGSVRSAGA